MTQALYLIHRAAKRCTPSPSELSLLDRDLADAGIAIPMHAPMRRDPDLLTFVDRAIKAALRAA